MSSRSDSSTAQPSFHLLQQGLRRFVSMYRAVKDGHRSDPARLQATHGAKSQLAVRRGLSRLDADDLADSGEKVVRTLDVTGRAGADDAGMSSARLQGEEVIEGGHAIHPAGRQL